MNSSRVVAKSLLVVLIVANPALLIGQFPYSTDPPHLGNGIECMSCHIAPRLDNATLCMSCHNPAGVASNLPFSNADRAVPGVSGTSHAWDVKMENPAFGAQPPTHSDLAPPIYEVPSDEMVCSSCHDQHSQEFPPFLRISNYQNAMCQDCHAVRNVGSFRNSPDNKGSHPVGVVYPSTDPRFFSSPQNPNLPLVDPNRVECTTCHGPHYADSGGANGSAGDGYILRAANNNALCKSCHTYPDHMGQSCRDCHQPHDPNRTNLFIVKETVATPNSGNTSVIFVAESGTNSFADGDATYDGICEVCHTTTNHHQNDGTAPGGQAHFNGNDCTQCHAHADGFLPSGAAVPPPHDAFCCETCHVTPDTYVRNAQIPNTACQACHAEGVLKTHFSDHYLDPTTGQLANLNCVECHNPMSVQSNFRGIDNLNFVRTTVRGNQVVFEAETGPYSFAYDLADRPGDMATENYLCNTCHTQTNYHQADGTATISQTHNDGLDCTGCHSHSDGFNPVGGHPDGWLIENSPDFHGLFIRNSGWDLDQCQACHGTDYAGGITNVSCLTCHPSTPEDCVVCHGGIDNQTGAPPEDIDSNHSTSARGVGAHTIHMSGGDLSSGFDCESCHVVPGSFDASGHVDSDLPAELTFSGLALEDGANPQWNGQTCQNSYCHGSFGLGNSGNAPDWTTVDSSQAACGTCHGLPPGGSHPASDRCSTCHGAVVDGNKNIIDKTLHINGETEVTAAHPDGWINPSSLEFHGLFIRNSGWDLQQCQACHGTDYAGGIANVSCLSCHPSTPEDCVVCHGGIDNQTGAPPEDIDSNHSTSARGVGAHTIHMSGGDLSSGFDCKSCHNVPESFDVSGHVDSDLPAELTFSGLALHDGANPQWNGQTCQNAYCHGSFGLGNSGNAPDWTTVDSSQAACGTCHGLPPGGSHPASDQCSTCHGAVVDGNKNIIDKTLHINGVTDVTQAHPSGWVAPNSPEFHGLFIRNSSWDLQQCQACHGTDYAGGITNVSCLSCHPSTPEDCVVCHGGVDNQTGAPPEDIDGNRITSARGVGAHNIHLMGGELSSAIDCQTCHIVPGSFDVSGHVDSDLPAELTFSGLALQDGANPQWNGETCQNAYCHGGFRLGNSSNVPDWTTVDGTQAACGTCHGLPPSRNHPPLDQCSKCHGAVVDDNKNIIDKSLHINGVRDLKGSGPTNKSPSADANGPYTGTVGQAVQFDGSGSSDPAGSIVSYMWDFGDGATGSGVRPTHTYTAAGTFNVTLTVTDNDGATGTDGTTATISDAPPGAVDYELRGIRVEHAKAPNKLTVSVHVRFKNIGTAFGSAQITMFLNTVQQGNPVSIIDDPGNGPGRNADLRVTFPGAGVYEVRVELTDDVDPDDDVESLTKTVTVR